MTIIWKADDNGEWQPIEPDTASVLGRDRLEPVNPATAAASHAEPQLMPAAGGAPVAKWLLLASPGSGVLVNGESLENGIRVLADRDALRIGDQPVMYFSTERLARVEPFAGGEDIYCPRDKILINKGDAAVRCPGCNVWHHQQEGRECWTYAGTCALCDQPTDLDATSYRWSPELLEQ